MGILIDIGGPAVIILAIYSISNFLRTRREIQRRKKQYGCQEAPSYPHKDPFFGSDLFRDNNEYAKTFRLLDRWTSRYQEYGKTFTANFQGTPAICTIDAANLQSITTTNFKDYGVQPMRRDATLPFLGEGVFTMDGKFWEHSRALIRPSFSNTNIANLAAFEMNLEKFIKVLPKDGATVDLKPLLCKLVYLDMSWIRTSAYAVSLSTPRLGFSLENR